MFLITANSWKTQLEQKNKDIENLKMESRNLKARFNRERDFYMTKFSAVAVMSTAINDKRLEACMQECDSVEDDDLERYMCRNEGHEELRANLSLVSSIAETAARECADNKTCLHNC